jgi:hypothetical protein
MKDAYTLMKGADESRCGVVLYARKVMRPTTALVLFLCCFGRAPASVTLSSGLSATRTTIPVSFDGRRASCVLDTGSSAIILSPMLARYVGLVGERGTFEVAPDGQTYADRETRIPRFTVAGYLLRDIHALISSHLSGYSALCGYDFFMRFPTLIDRERSTVTLYPAASKFARLHCLPVSLSPRVPLAKVEINGTWLSQIVLDSGMAGGGALWDAVRSRLRNPLVSNAAYPMNRAGFDSGFSCGNSAVVRFAAGTPASSIPICTEPGRPDGYNGIIETNLPGVHAMAVDYPHRRICFGLTNLTAAWARFNNLRSP